MTMKHIFEKIKQERGESALRDGKQLIGLFADYSKGQLKPQANALKVFLDCQGNTRILNLRSVPRQTKQVEFYHLTQEMVNDHFMQEAAALEICGTFWRVANGTEPPIPEERPSTAVEPELLPLPPEPSEPALTAEELYQQGKACHQNFEYAEAAKWYRKAAEQGHMQAQLDLGFAYENGLGTEKNSIEGPLPVLRAASCCSTIPTTATTPLP